MSLARLLDLNQTGSEDLQGTLPEATVELASLTHRSHSKELRSMARGKCGSRRLSVSVSRTQRPQARPQRTGPGLHFLQNQPSEAPLLGLKNKTNEEKSEKDEVRGQRSSQVAWQLAGSRREQARLLPRFLTAPAWQAGCSPKKAASGGAVEASPRQQSPRVFRKPRPASQGLSVSSVPVTDTQTRPTESSSGCSCGGFRSWLASPVALGLCPGCILGRGHLAEEGAGAG